MENKVNSNQSEVRFLVSSQLSTFAPAIILLENLSRPSYLVVSIICYLFAIPLIRGSLVREIGYKPLTIIHYSMLVHSLFIAHIFKYLGIWSLSVALFIMGFLVWISLIMANIELDPYKHK